MSLLVQNALSHLKDLEDAMRIENVSFKPEDIENCDSLAQILQDLELSVKNLHEELETETIKASVFRHKMTFFDIDLKREIEENVRAARDSNMETILDLEKKLELLTKNIEILHKKDKQLSEEISLMEPEKKSLEANHEYIIKSLNDQMAHKAKAQITLNETRDLLRELNQNILELEEDMIALNEKLIKERSEARDIKIGLEDEKRETNSKAFEQEESNSIKLREVQASKKTVQESNKQVRILFRENERYEQLNKDLVSEIENGTKHLERQQRAYEILVTESLRLTTLEAKTQQDYNDNKTNTINRTKETSERTTEEIENVKSLKELQEVKRTELKEIYERFKELQKINDTIKKSIDSIKAEIGEKYKEMAELEAKNQELYVLLGENQQSHSQVMDSLQREAEQCREQLQHEREQRMKKQAERDAKLSEIEAFNANLIIFQSSVAGYLNTNKSRAAELETKEKELNQTVAHNEREKTRLGAELETATRNYELMKSELESNVNNLETEMNFFMTENNKNVSEIKELEPKYKQLCKLFREKCKEYEETRKAVIDSKNRKSNLENRIVEVKQSIIDHDKSRDELKVGIQEKRAEFLGQMKDQKQEAIELENVILQTGLKLQTLKQENNKFVKALTNFEPEFKYMDSLSVEELCTQEMLEKEYDNLNRQLIQGWQNDNELKEFFKEKDTDLVNRLGELFDTTLNRENKVGAVTNKLYQELESMENYLLKMIKREPNQIKKNDQDKK